MRSLFAIHDREANPADLFLAADRARCKWCGEEVHLRGVIEFSNVCSRDCFYCGLRKSNKSLPRYSMPLNEIIAVTAKAEKAGVRTIVLQSGENDSQQPEELAQIVAAIKKNFDVAVTLSVGCKPFDFYNICRQAGADRYLIKHEIATPSLYNRYHPDSSLADRLSALETLRILGYQIGTGNIIGLLGQTSGNLMQDIMLTKEFDVDMAAFGPFIPHPYTPLAGHPAGRLDLSLKFISAARLRLGPVHIPATTAFDAVAPNGRETALCCGANVIMANITPDKYKPLYDIYPSDRSSNSVKRVKEMLCRLERPLARNHGHSLKSKREKCSEHQKA